MKRDEYVLGWLDHTVHLSLNPLKDLPNLSARDLQLIKQRARSEVDTQIGFLHKGALLLLNQKKIKVFINQYHQTLVFLLDRSHLNLASIQPGDAERADCCKAVILCIEKILELVQIRFNKYIVKGRAISKNQGTQIQNELLEKVEKLSARFIDAPQCRALTSIIWTVIREFAAKKPSTIYYSQILYFQGLTSHLERIELTADLQTLHDRLIHLLIGLNFNDKRFVSYYIQYVASKVNQSESPKMPELLLFRKQFYQAYVSCDQALYCESPSIRKLIGNWFKQETSFLDQVGTEHVSAINSSENIVINTTPQTMPKVMCLLSADQIGIILHSLDALRIIQAKSMSAVFETIVPSLSTMQKRDLSWKSMRSKSYVFEENDRKVVIAALQSVIKYIDEY
jgi:hypothetical protein